MKVAISSDFFTALSRLPKTQFNKTIKLVEKFKNSPTSAGINYEKLHFSSDGRMHSIRVDDTYRCIVLKPESGDVYLLLWVDHHDEAYEWAKRHKCMVHPETGSLQIIEIEHILSNESNALEQEHGTCFFSDYRDKDLLRIGVPESMLLEVKQIKNELDLDKLQNRLPEEAYEGLFYLMAGDTLDDVLQYVSIQETEEKIDTDDFVKALNNENSKRRFYVVDGNDIDLMSMLNAPLEKWRVFLHPSQRKLINRDWSGPVRVLGGAGTGKTVVAMHRAKWLAQKALITGGKVLFTTFTKNLAVDIHENLKKICSEELLERIEVKNLDQWVYEFLYKNGYRDRIVYSDESDKIWDEAIMIKPSQLELSESFFKEEWERVIQPQSVTTLDEYIKASRIGRGTRLNRTQRKDVWDVFDEYRTLMAKHSFKEPSDAMRDARTLVENGKLEEKYSSVVVDEGQDFSQQGFMLLRSIVQDGKNDMFIVGDAHQRIYGHKVFLGQCSIKIVGRSRKLKLNYRTTDEIRKWAVKIFQSDTIDDLDSGIDSNKDYKSLYHGPEPLVKHLDSFEEEITFLKSYIDELVKEDSSHSICLMLRTKKLVSEYKTSLEKLNVSIYVLNKDSKDDVLKSGIRLATMHRIKGLDFDHVIIAHANQGTIPLQSIIHSGEELIEKEMLLKEKSLLFVSATRAKKTLAITSFGEISSFIPK